MPTAPITFAARRAALLAEVHRLEAEAWPRDAAPGFLHYLLVCGAQRWGAPLFAINVLCAHAFAWAPPRAMDFESTLAGFIGFHLAGVGIALTLWLRNHVRYGPPGTSASSAAATSRSDAT